MEENTFSTVTFIFFFLQNFQQQPPSLNEWDITKTTSATGYERGGGIVLQSNHTNRKKIVVFLVRFFPGASFVFILFSFLFFIKYMEFLRSWARED